MYIYYTHILLLFILVFSILGLQFKKIFYSCIFHPASFPHKKNYYSILAYACIHANWQHLFINMLGLYIFGIEAEEFLQLSGLANWLIYLIFISGILSASLVALIRYKNKLDFSLVGASHGIFSLIASNLVLQPFKVIKFIPIPIPHVYLIILFILLLSYKIRQTKSKVDYLGHFIGFSLGMLFGFCLKIASFPAI